MVQWLREVVAAHYYFDPLTAILGDIVFALAIVLAVEALFYLKVI